jgi:hypothetical protein
MLLQTEAFTQSKLPDDPTQTCCAVLPCHHHTHPPPSFPPHTQCKRSSRLSAKALRRTDGTGRSGSGPADQSGPATPGSSRPSPPVALLEQLPAADLLLMAAASCALSNVLQQQLAEHLGMAPAALTALMDAATSAAQPAAAAAAAAAGGGGRTHGGPRAAAAAAQSWAVISANVGGPQLSRQQRTALVAWLQQQCTAPGAGEGMLGPVTAPQQPDTPRRNLRGSGTSDAVGGGDDAKRSQQQAARHPAGSGAGTAGVPPALVDNHAARMEADAARRAARHAHSAPCTR